MTKLELAGLHPTHQRLLNVARENARTIERSKIGIAYLSSDGFYHSNFSAQKLSIGGLSEEIVNGNFFERLTHVPREKHRGYFDCIGLYGEKLDPDSEEIQHMLTLRDDWGLPIYLMNESENVWRIEPNDEFGRNLIYMTTIHLSHIK